MLYQLPPFACCTGARRGAFRGLPEPAFSMKLRVLLAATLCVLSACTADAPTLASPQAAPPSLEVQHASTSGYPGFYFYNGIIPGDTALGTFDGGLSPTVRICRMTGSTCGSTLATVHQHHRVVQPPGDGERRRGPLPGGLAHEPHGRGDGPDLPRLGDGGYAPAGVHGREDGEQLGGVLCHGPGRVHPLVRREARSPSTSASRRGCRAPSRCPPRASRLNVGAGVPVSATLRDLYGQPVADPVLWWVEHRPGVALLDSGMVVGLAGGDGHPVGVVRRHRGGDPRHGDGHAPCLDRAGHAGRPGQPRRLWGSAANNVYAANHTGMLRTTAPRGRTCPPVRWRSPVRRVGIRRDERVGRGRQGRAGAVGRHAHGRCSATTVPPSPRSPWATSTRRRARTRCAACGERRRTTCSRWATAAWCCATTARRGRG